MLQHNDDYEETEAPLERVEHPRFYDLRGRLSKSYGEGVPELQRAAGHARDADRDIARFLREHGLDAGAARGGLDAGAEGGGGPSVLGRMREGLDRTAQLLGLKTEQPYYPPGMAGSGGGGSEAEGPSLADRLSAAWRSMPGASRLFTSEHAAAEEEARHEGARYAVGGKEYTYDELASELAKVRRRRGTGVVKWWWGRRCLSCSCPKSPHLRLRARAQAAGVTDRTLIDRIADTLETLHIKRTPPIKALARDIAERSPHIDVEGAWPA